MILHRLFYASVELSIIALFALILIRLLKIRSARLRALIWLVVMIKPIFIMAFGAPVAIPISWRPFHLHRFSSGMHTTNPFTPINRATPIPGQTKDIQQPLPELKKEPAVMPSGEKPETIAPVALVRSDFSKGISFKYQELISCILFAWLAGIFVSAILFLKGRRILKGIIQKSRAPLSNRIKRTYTDICMESRIKKPPPLLVSHEIMSPALVRILRPVILIPAWLDTEEYGGTLRWILRHELTHYKMKDPLGLLVKRVFLGLFFFHPLAWFAAKKWMEAMETACDRILIKTDDDATYYARALYTVIEYIREKQEVKYAQGLFATQSRIGKRIAALLKRGVKYPAQLSVIQIVLFCCLSLAALSCGIHFSSADAKNPVKTSCKKEKVPVPEETVKQSAPTTEKKEVARENPEDILYFEDFSAMDITRPKGWEIVGAPEKDFWRLKKGSFYTGNGDDLTNGNGWSYAILKQPKTDTSGQCASVKFNMIQRNGALAIIFGWKDMNNHFRAVLESLHLHGNKAMKIIQVKDGKENILSVFTTTSNDAIEPFDNGKGGNIKLYVNDDRITMIYNDNKRITAKADIGDLKKGFWGLGEWFNMVYFDDFRITAFSRFDEIPKPKYKTISRDPMMDSGMLGGFTAFDSSAPPFNEKYPYRITVAEGISETEAKNLQKKLKDAGYSPTHIKKEDGYYTVRVGLFITSEEAEYGIKSLMNDGFSIRGYPGSSKTKKKPLFRDSTMHYSFDSGVFHALPCFDSSAPPFNEKYPYRITVAEGISETEAENLQRKLKAAGYCPTEISEEEEGKYTLRVGLFNTSEEAKKASESLKKEVLGSLKIPGNPNTIQF